MLDTNLLLDWLLYRDSERTARVDALFGRSASLYVPDFIVMELVFVLETIYELSRVEIAANLQQLLDEPVIRMNRQLVQLSIVNYSSHPAWSFVDCLLVAESTLKKVTPIWTFDRKLLSQSNGQAQKPDTPIS